MSSILRALLSHSGLWALTIAFAAVTMESAAFVGLVIPGESVALIVGALAGAGVLNLWWALGAIAGGAICGDVSGYVLGRWKGEALLAQWALARRHHKQHRQQVQRYFARWGAATVIIGRFIAIGRAFVPFTAGLYRMPPWRFVPMAVLAGAVWGAAIVGLGYWLGSRWRIVEEWLRSIGLGMLGLLVLTVLAFALWRWLSRHEEQLQALWERHFEQRFGIKTEPLLAFFRARLSPTGYLGLHFTLGIMVMAAMTWLFGGVVQDIFAQDPLVRVDRLLKLLVAEHRTPALDSVMAVAAFLADPYLMPAVAVIAAVTFAAARDRIMAFAALPLLASAYAIGIGLRELFENFSPWVPPSRVVHGFHGFPSIAMIMATNAYGLAGYALGTYARDWRWRTLGAVAAFYLVIVAGCGEVYRQQNLSAQIGGFAAGGCWLAICLTGILSYEKLRTAA